VPVEESEGFEQKIQINKKHVPFVPAFWADCPTLKYAFIDFDGSMTGQSDNCIATNELKIAIRCVCIFIYEQVKHHGK